MDAQKMTELSSEKIEVLIPFGAEDIPVPKDGSVRIESINPEPRFYWAYIADQPEESTAAMRRHCPTMPANCNNYIHLSIATWKKP